MPLEQEAAVDLVRMLPQLRELEIPLPKQERVTNAIKQKMDREGFALCANYLGACKGSRTFEHNAVAQVFVLSITHCTYLKV
jgi:hypothetical protein